MLKIGTVVLISLGIALVVTLALSWALAQGLLREGTALRWLAVRVTGWWDRVALAFFVALGIVTVMRGRGRLRKVAKRAKAQAKARAGVRKTIANASAEIRRTNAASAGRITDMRIASDNRVYEIRREVEAMDDAALLKAAREAGQ